MSDPLDPIYGIDGAAHQAATSPISMHPEPTDAQKEAGNFKKGHLWVQGLALAIENPRGSTRSGPRPDGSTWSHVMSDHYGYIKRTVGADDEQIDVYLGPQPGSDRVFIVDQLHQQTGGFDEHKVMLGFPNQIAAARAYRANFDRGWKVGAITAMSMAQFKAWLRAGDTASAATKLHKSGTEVHKDGTDVHKHATPTPLGRPSWLLQKREAAALHQVP